MVQERIGSQYVGFQPGSPDILAAFSFYSSRLPHDEQQLAKGLVAAIEKAPFLERFVDLATKLLTDEA